MAPTGDKPLSEPMRFSLLTRVCVTRPQWVKWPMGNSNDYIMMTSSNGNIFRVTGPLCGEFTGPGEFPTQRPVTRSFDVFFDLRLNKRLSKQPWGWWFETPSWSLWLQCNDNQKRRCVLLCFVVGLLFFRLVPISPVNWDDENGEMDRRLDRGEHNDSLVEKAEG